MSKFVTVSIAFPHYAAHQTAMQSVRIHAGNPATATLALLHPPIRTELRLARAHTGSPVTARVVFPYHISQQAKIRSIRTHVESSVTTKVAFPHHVSQRIEWRSTLAYSGSPISTTIRFPKLPIHIASLKWEADWRTYATTAIRFRNNYRNFITASVAYQYDWKRIISTALCYKHWSLVPPGWKIVAKNLETEESLDIGFIDADTKNPSLKDIFLPNGDYEISVLTSSLFWKDCQERTI
jgi:hypothetical protein